MARVAQYWPRQRGSALVKVLLAGTVIAIGAGAVLMATGPEKGKEQAKATGKPGGTADQATVQKMSFDISTTSTGELKAKKQTEIRSELETESTIVEIVAEGIVAKKGDQLIKLNGDPIQTQIDEETLRVESAKADLVAAENSYEIQKSENESKTRQAQLKLDLAELALKQWDKGERVQKEKDIELALDESDKELTRLREKWDKSKELQKEGFLSKDQLQMDGIAHRKAVAARDKAVLEQQTFQNYQKPKDQKSKESDVAEAKAELSRTNQQNEIQLVSKDADRINKRRQLALREDKMSKLQKQLAACTIKAPQDGLVVYASSQDSDFIMFNGQGPLQVGRKVYPNENLIVLPDTTHMLAQVKVHESLASKVRPGQSATVKVDAAGGQTFNGKIDSIGVLAEGGGWRDPNRREYTVKILLEHDHETTPLKPSMRCEATIQLGHVDEALAVPLQAVFNEEMVRFVYVPKGSKFSRVPVLMAQKSDTFAEIKAGLEEGTRVLVRQPQPNEVLQSPWDEAQLKLAGLKFGADGKVVAIAPPKMPGGGPMKMGGAPAGTVIAEKPGEVKIEGATVAVPAPAGETTAQPVTASAPAGGESKK